jgi:hypothetical protein
VAKRASLLKLLRFEASRIALPLICVLRALSCVRKVVGAPMPNEKLSESPEERIERANTFPKKRTKNYTLIGSGKRRAARMGATWSIGG